MIEAMTRLRIHQTGEALRGTTGAVRATPEFDLQIHAEATAGAGTRARLEKENAALHKQIASLQRQLGDAVFVEKAPGRVVDGMRTKLLEYQAQVAQNEKLLRDLA